MVTQALRHAKWKISAYKVQGTSKLTTIRVQPSQWLLTLQLLEDSHHRKGRRPTGLARYTCLIVKASEFAGGGELGLFAARQFNTGALINAYAGVPAKTTVDASGEVTLVRGGSVDVTCSPDGGRVICFGGHYCNSPYWDISIEDRSKYEQSHCTKKHNAVFDGFQIRACSQIRKGGDILLYYNPKDQTVDTSKILKERRKTNEASG